MLCISSVDPTATPSREQIFSTKAACVGVLGGARCSGGSLTPFRLSVGVEKINL